MLTDLLAADTTHDDELPLPVVFDLHESHLLSLRSPNTIAVFVIFQFFPIGVTLLTITIWMTTAFVVVSDFAVPTLLMTPRTLLSSENNRHRRPFKKNGWGPFSRETPPFSLLNGERIFSELMSIPIDSAISI